MIISTLPCYSLIIINNNVQHSLDTIDFVISACWYFFIIWDFSYSILVMNCVFPGLNVA